MTSIEAEQPEDELELRRVVPELVIYAGLVVGYFYAVLFLLDDWLARTHGSDPTLYAVASLVLIVGQGYVLERVTALLMRLVRSMSE